MRDHMRAIVNARVILHVESEWREKQCASVLQGALSADNKNARRGKCIPAGNVCMLRAKPLVNNSRGFRGCRR